MAISLGRVKRKVARVGGSIYMRGVERINLAVRGTPSPLRIFRLANEEQFGEIDARMQAEKAARREYERSLSQNRTSIQTHGYCFVCSRWSHFSSSWSYSSEVDGRPQVNWREHLICRHCELNNRMRAAIHLAAETGMGLGSLKVYATEQTTRLFAILRGRCGSLVGSEFLGDAVPRGATNSAGIANQDLTRLTFEDGEFDLVLSFEVMEHIPNYHQAFKECARVLKPGGKMLFSTPFNASAAKNLIRARLRADHSVEYLLPPEYHGDPINANGCLCFTHFGWELLEEVRQAGFRQVTALLYYSVDYGYLGDQQIQFLAEK
jgi:SAM-dependent methyltransferase